MLRLLLAFSAILWLAACAGGEQGGLPQEQLDKVAFAPSAPPALTLITVINNRTGRGGHAALMVTGSQQVLFDPAGSFRPDWMTEYGDVLYGMSDRYFTAYQSAHSRNTFHVVTQKIEVAPEVAERALNLVQTNGRVPGAFCANATSGILRQLPGFQDTLSTFYPEKLMNDFARRPGVVTNKRFENDEGHVLDGIPNQQPSE